MRRIFAVLILIGILFSIVGCEKAPEQEFDPFAVETYWEIPGITGKDISDVEELLETKDSFTYGHLIETEAFIQPDGTQAGFVYSFCELLTGLFDFEFKPALYDGWGEMLDAFDGRTVDFIGELTQTPERTQNYYMTHAIAERSLRIYTRTDKTDIMTESDIIGKKIGFLEGTITANYVSQSYRINFEDVPVTGYADAVRQLESGEIDAFVLESIADPYFLDYDFIQSKEFFSLVYSPVSMSTANPELEPIITVVNKYLAAGGIDVLYKLYKQGDYEYARYKLLRSFSDSELSYLEELSAQNEAVLIGYEHDNYPYCFYNTSENEFQGIAVDILDEIGHLTGISFKSAMDKDATWSSILEKLRVGEIAMVSQLLYSDTRLGEFLWSEEPYATSNYSLVSKADYPALAVFQVIRARVGYSYKTMYEEMFKSWFPEHNSNISFNTQNEGFDALEHGEIDLLMTSEDMLLFQTNYREKPGFKVNIRFDAPVYSYFGFSIGEAQLCSIVSKAQELVNTRMIENSWTSRTFDYSVKLANQRTAYFGVFSAGLLIVLIIVIVLLLKNYRLSEAQRKAEYSAQVASSAKSTFLANMSHEMRTPLNAIIGMSDIAKSTGDIVKKDGCIDRIAGASRHLLGIINDTLDMSKIESGKLELAEAPFDLREALDGVLSIIRQSCEEKHIRLTTNIAGLGSITLIGDKLRLNQTLINLLGNAVKFTEKGGSVLFSVKKLHEYDRSVNLRFTISDTGIGMTEEQMKRLFLPFEQGDRNVAATYGGTGLGLSISSSIVRMMGSDIVVESKLGEGTTFRFEICLPLGEKSTIAENLRGDTPNLSGKRILLAEDVEINRIIVRELLSPTYAEIIEAENGQRAVELFMNSAEGYYDLILMDVQMPVKDGYEATKYIRSTERAEARRIPIISMTANAYKEDEEMALISGMNGHLSKPIDVGALMAVLSEFLSTPQ